MTDTAEKKPPPIKGLKAARYMMRKGNDGKMVPAVEREFAQFLVDDLPYLSYTAALEWYESVMLTMTDADERILGANDRFYLLTKLLNRPDALHPWIYDRCREVEANPDGYIDLWARFHYKSTIMTFAGNIQDIIDNPELTIAVFSNTLPIARPFLRQIKQELEQNKDLIQLYDDVFYAEPKKYAPKWSEHEGIVVKRRSNPKEATVEAHGLIDALPTGRHFGKLCYDDVVEESSVNTPDMIKKTTDRWELSTNLGKATGSRLQIIGTRYSFADTYGVLIANGVARTRIHPATHNGKLEGRPVFLTNERWAEIKKQQRSSVPAQMLLNPLAGSENMFRLEWLRPYWLRPSRMNVYIMGDPSLGKSASSDRTALAVIGIDVNMNRYLLDGYCHRMRMKQRWEYLSGLYKKWVNHPGVENVHVGYERYGQQTDLEYFEEQMQKPRAPIFSIKELNWVQEGQQSKPKRVERLQPYFEDSEFFVPCRLWHPNVQGGDAVWSIDQERSIMQYRSIAGPTRRELDAMEKGEHYRIVKPIKRRDEDGNLYDLFRVFVEEFEFFPFSPRDDLIDAMSRIEDMEPIAPSLYEEILLARRAERDAPPDA